MPDDSPRCGMQRATICGAAEGRSENTTTFGRRGRPDQKLGAEGQTKTKRKRKTQRSAAQSGAERRNATQCNAEQRNAARNERISVGQPSMAVLPFLWPVAFLSSGPFSLGGSSSSSCPVCCSLRDVFLLSSPRPRWIVPLSVCARAK